MDDPRPTDPTLTDTADPAYTARLRELEGRGWKQRLDVQRPYRWNLRRLHPGRVLDVGCGIGRNLSHLDGNGVGVDHNAESVATARERGLTAYTAEEFASSPDAVPGAFDSVLVAHVLEHLDLPTQRDLLATYLPYIREGGRVILITPQEAGFSTDPTHVRFVDPAACAIALREHGWRVVSKQSFPFPRPVGRVFPYNEFVVVGEHDPDA